MSQHLISNWNELAENDRRREALEILEAGLQAVDTKRVVRDLVKLEGDTLRVKNETFNLSQYERLLMIGIGKCALTAGQALEEILGDRLTDGMILDVRSGPLKKLKSYTGTHPFPSENNVRQAKEVIKLLEAAGEKDLVLAVVSGGGSALLCAPYDQAPSDLKLLTSALMRQGAKISEVNVVRKHLSLVQGGGLAKITYPARLCTLIFSDVPGNDIGLVASGPTVPDASTKDEALAILRRYGFGGRTGAPLPEMLETPKEPHWFEQTTNLLAVTNFVALQAMESRAENLGYKAEIRDYALQGEACLMGAKLAKEIKVTTAPACLLYGGELTVTVKVKGEGGRCQELVLGALADLPADAAVVASSSDGWDNTPAAGALGDHDLIDRARLQGVSAADYLERNASYEFFGLVGGRIMTGPTGINISDLYFVLRK